MTVNEIDIKKVDQIVGGKFRITLRDGTRIFLPRTTGVRIAKLLGCK